MRKMSAKGSVPHLRVADRAMGSKVKNGSRDCKSAGNRNGETMYKTGEYRTRIKLCGLSRPCDIEAANELKPDYIGFVFAPRSCRYVMEEKAEALREQLDPNIAAVGVFVNEHPETIAGMLNLGIIDIAQLHGGEDEEYIKRLQVLTHKLIIKAFRIETEDDAMAAENSSADYVLLDSGSGGTGTVFHWKLIENIRRPYFLAGGLNVQNAGEAVRKLKPYGVDVSSGIETDGSKDREKMKAFVHAVRSVTGKEETR